MRIGMFTDMYKPYTSGVTNHISLYKTALEGLGNEIYVFTFGDADHDDEELNVIRSPGMAFGDTGWRFGLRFSSRARDIIPTLDIAHAHHPFLSGRLALRACRPHGIPSVFTNHTRYDLYSDVYARFLPQTFRYWFLKSQLRSLYSRADLVISPSAEIAGWLRTFGVDAHVEVLPNAIDTHMFGEPAAPRSKDALGFAPTDVVLCYLGRLGEEKNLGLLTEAFVRAAIREPRLALLLIGDGPARNGIELRVEKEGLAERVRLTGLVDYAEVPDLLAAADVFVTASVSEVHPLTVMEGMAAGLPVVGVRSPGVEETVEDGVTGLLVAEDAQEIADAMLRFTDDVFRTRSSEAARLASGGYGIAPAAERLLALYERVITTRHPLRR